MRETRSDPERANKANNSLIWFTVGALLVAVGIPLVFWTPETVYMGIVIVITGMAMMILAPKGLVLRSSFRITVGFIIFCAGIVISFLGFILENHIDLLMSVGKGVSTFGVCVHIFEVVNKKTKKSDRRMR